MKIRWVKQLLHGELDSVRETWLSTAADAPIDLEVEFEMPEQEQQPITAESEQEAAKVLAAVAEDMSEHERIDCCAAGSHAGQEEYEAEEWWSWDADDADYPWYEAADSWAEDAADPFAVEASVALVTEAEPACVPTPSSANEGTQHDALGLNMPKPVEEPKSGKPLVDPPEFGERIVPLPSCG